VVVGPPQSVVGSGEHHGPAVRSGVVMFERARAPGGPRRLALAVGVALAATSFAWAAAPAARAATTLSISVSGNHFVNGAGQKIRLLGVNAPSTEYACDEGWGYSSQPLTAATAQAIAQWHANAVRVPLNEDCWLGLNHKPSFGTQAGYQQAIKTWVAALNAQGLYAILDLHWTAPGTGNADGQRPMPDDHSAAFWTSVAGTFASNPAVVFDAFNEPYSPAANGNSSLAVSWSCWLNGGCALPVANQNDTINDSDTYVAVGMQTLVNAIRATGATQPILLGGLSYANDLSGWLAHEPTDPDHALAASFHNYYGESCDTVSCWNTTIAGVAATAPVVTGEFDQGFDCANPPTGPASLTTFDQAYMNWSDAHGVSYVAWGWWVLGNTSTTCSALGGGGDNFALISSYAGTPVAPDGTVLHSHLAALYAATLLHVTTASLAIGAARSAYSATLAASGGVHPYTWSIASGALPAGLHLSTAGVISGTPTTIKTSAFTVKVVDTHTATHTQQTATKALSIKITQAHPAITKVSPSSGPNATHVTITGTTFNGATKVLFGSVAATTFSVKPAATGHPCGHADLGDGTRRSRGHRQHPGRHPRRHQRDHHRRPLLVSLSGSYAGGR
jgi:endoglucanase